MLRRSLTIQFVLLTIAVFTVVGLSSSWVMRKRYAATERELRVQYIDLVGNLVDEVTSRYGVNAIAAFDQMGEIAALLRFDWWLVDSNLKVLHHKGRIELPANVTPQTLPTAGGQSEILRMDAANDWTLAVRLKRNDSLWVVMDRTPAHGRVGLQIRNAVIGLLFTITMATIIISLGFVFLYLRSRSREAQQVLTRLQAGELGARFVVRREDEVSGLMLQFNEMAGEIQRLVQSLQRNERVKVELLQELGHDLRTPLTTIQNLLETLADAEKMPEVRRKESLDLALRELSYTKKLLEDLFFIARMNEPKYGSSTEKVDLRSLVLTEAETLSKNENAARLRWDWSEVGKAPASEVYGNANLLQRMIRNILNNARRFAATEVNISLQHQANGETVLRVADDGGGFSSEALVNYGNRAKARALPKIDAGEISTGLGSVIVKSVASLHGASVEVKNSPLPSGHLGASVEIRFKKAA